MSEKTRPALLDTSVLIDYPARAVIDIAGDATAVSAISVAELQYGVAAPTDPVEQMLRRQRIQVVIDRYDVLPFDLASADYYGALAARLRRMGRDPRPRRMDLQIAATAARYGLTLLTRNGDDFAGLEGAVEVIAV